MKKFIEINELCHMYVNGRDRVEALKGASLSVGQGEIFGFLGPNGAGKTTTIKHLLGILIPQSGTVSILGVDPSKAKNRSKVGYMPETSDLYDFLTPTELLFMYGDIFRMPRKLVAERIEILLDIVGMTSCAKRRMKTFSKGMKQKVCFAQAMINDPDLLILDEPTGGLDPLARKKMRSIILSLREKGKTVFFSSHELSEVELICDRVAILYEGKVLEEGPLVSILSKKGEVQTLENYFMQIIGADK